MRSLKFFLLVIPLLGLAAYRLHHQSAAAALIDRSFAPSWSRNEHVISSLEERLHTDPNNVKANSILGHAYLQRARESGDPTYYTRADVLFERALKRDPKSVEALLGKASLLMARHNFREAKDVATTAIQANPDVVATYGVLTDALVELGEVDAAIRTLDTMVRRKPNLSSYSRVSYVREIMGDLTGAIQAMKMAIDSGAPNAENTAWCMVQLGILYLRDGRLNEAEEQFQRALVRFPEYAHAFAGLARVATAREDFVLAEQHYRRAMDRIPLPEFATGLAKVYERMGRNKDAKAQHDLVHAIEQLYRANGVSSERGRTISSSDAMISGR
jgi:tetratricopeptide (TPR) repeat protein